MSPKKKSSRPFFLIFLGILLFLSLLGNATLFFFLEKKMGMFLKSTNHESLSDSEDLPEFREISKDLLLFRDRAYVAHHDPLFDIILLSDASCSSCTDIAALRNLISPQFPTATLTEVDISSNMGKEILSSGVVVVPAVLFSQEFQSSPSFAALAKGGSLLPIGGKYFELRTAGNKRVLSENQLPKISLETEAETLVAYLDLLDPSTRDFWEKELPKITEELPSVSLDIRPLILDAPSALAAEAWFCGASPEMIVKGAVSFREATRSLMANTALSEEDRQLAFVQEGKTFIDALSLSKNQKICLDTHQKQQEVDAAQEEIRRLGLSSSPAFFWGEFFFSAEETAEERLTIWTEMLKKETLLKDQ